MLAEKRPSWRSAGGAKVRWMVVSVPGANGARVEGVLSRIHGNGSTTLMGPEKAEPVLRIRTSSGVSLPRSTEPLRGLGVATSTE